MTSSSKIIAIIPAFNEEKTIEKVIAGIRPYVSNIVVVDDCSLDATGMVAKRAGALVVRHTQNRGYDKSIDDGFLEAYKQGADIMVTFDADGQHRPEDLKKITDMIVKGEADLVVGQRENITHFGEKIFALYTNFFFKVKDPLSGLKAYSKKVYEAMGHFDTISSIGTQLMIGAVRKGFVLKIVPIIVKEREDNSRFYAKSFKANYKILKALIKLILFE